MKIRKATIKDFEQIKKIRTEFYLHQTKLDNLNEPNWIKRGLGIATSKALKSKRHIFFIAEDKGKIIGYCSGVIDKLPRWLKLKKKGHLYNVFVKKEYRKKGIGKKLMFSVIDWFKQNKISWIQILVYSKNKNAYKIYKKLGFKDYIIEMNKIIK